MDDVSVTVYRSVDDVPANRWNNVVEQAGMGSCFQRTEWLAALETGLDIEPYHVTVERGDDLVAVCPNVTRPIGLPDDADVPGGERLQATFREVVSVDPGFGGPAIVKHDGAALASVAEAIDDASTYRTLFHRVKTVAAYVRYAQYFEALGYSPNVSNCRFLLDLWKGKDQLVTEMHGSRRRNLRKANAVDSDVKCVDFDPSTIERFHERYANVMDRVGGTRYPRSFFEALGRTFADRVRVFAATVDGTVVGYHLYVCDEERSTFHYLFSAVEKRYFEYYPSEIIHDHAIDYAIDAGYRYFDFGGTGANFDDGLFKYKEQYGGRVVPTIIWERGCSVAAPIYRRARTAYRRRTLLEDESTGVVTSLLPWK